MADEEEVKQEIKEEKEGEKGGALEKGSNKKMGLLLLIIIGVSAGLLSGLGVFLFVGSDNNANASETKKKWNTENYGENLPMQMKIGEFQISLGKDTVSASVVLRVSKEFTEDIAERQSELITDVKRIFRSVVFSLQEELTSKEFSGGDPSKKLKDKMLESLKNGKVGEDQVVEILPFNDTNLIEVIIGDLHVERGF